MQDRLCTRRLLPLLSHAHMKSELMSNAGEGGNNAIRERTKDGFG
jgi:hypothetical protein